MADVRFGVHIGTQFAPWTDIVRMIGTAEDAGYATAWTYDHFTAVMMDPFTPCLEAWSCLSALAALTSRIRLGTLVTGNTYRHPAVLAKMAATVDVISSGRLEFGVGAGWYEPEHTMYGIPYGSAPERIERLDEALTVVRLLWEQPRSSFAGKHFTLRDAVAEPKPVQRPRPPITVAGAGELRLLRVVARHADAWNCFGSPAVFRHKIGVLERHCEAEGRDPGTIEKAVLAPAVITDDAAMLEPLAQGFGAYLGVSPDEARDAMLAGTADDVCRRIEEFVAIGVTHFVLLLTFFNFDALERFAEHVLPRFG